MRIETYDPTVPPTLPNSKEPDWSQMNGRQTGRPATEEDVQEEAYHLYASIVPDSRAEN